MANLTLPVTLGVSNSVTITVAPTPADLAAPLVSVTLGFDYARSPPPGWPITVAGAAVASAGASTWANGATIVAGSVVTVSAVEAAALIAAGVAS